MLAFRPEEWGLEELADDPELMFLNVGPQHGGTHGVVHIVVGPARRGDRPLRRRHRLPPPRRREDGRAPDLAHLHPLHRPHRLPRRRRQQPRLPDVGRAALRHRGAGARPGHPRHALASSTASTATCVFYGTFAQDIGALSPVFYMFSDRERISRRRRRPITGGAHAPRLVPHRRRGRGPARRLGAARADFLDYLPPRLDEYDHLVHGQPHHQGADGQGRRARISAADAVDWGVTGAQPARRPACPGTVRKKRPYSRLRPVRVRRAGRPTTATATTASGVRVRGDPPEPAHHPPVPRAHAGRPLQVAPAAGHAAAQGAGTMHHIETLIDHFLGVSWGPGAAARRGLPGHRGDQGQQRLLPRSATATESAYRNRIRTPSFPHLQVLPLMAERLRDPRPHHRSSAASTSSWPTWTGEARMLTDDERTRDRGDAAPLPAPAGGGGRRHAHRAAPPRLAVRRGPGRRRRASSA